jgi:hypothetical protein
MPVPKLSDPKTDGSESAPGSQAGTQTVEEEDAR